MKLLLIFRGENQRYRNGYTGLIKATECLDNWNTTLFDDLKINNIDYDVMFITYESPILQELIEKIKPVKVITDGPPKQAGHLITASNLMLQQKHNYDRIVVLRYDIQYRFKITQWPKWSNTGIFIVSKDVNWHNNKCYHDFLFIVDSPYVDHLCNAIKDAMDGEDYHNRIGSYLYHNNIPFELMYQHGYHLVNHPLYALKHFEAEPDIENPYPCIIITTFDKE